MREIRFRAWSEENKEMYYRDFDDYVVPENTPLYHSGLNAHGELFAGHYLENGDYEDLVLMQFTGLKDKNGKEIFDGDIISDGKKKYEVIYQDACFWAVSKSNTHWIKHLYDCEHMEVIGNIHQNPELL